ncbi:MAG: T9SS type A sorting domain-containing protein, partial [Proteobacteria bacterium]|nr:T9SS type A sorting domain-containing protein [Pseudomonadota bacterium]
DTISTAEDLDSLGAGTYNVIATDANGCTTSQTVDITEPDVFVGGTLSSSQTICENETLNIISSINLPTGGNPPYTFDWEIDNGSGFTPFNNNNLSSYQPQLLPDTTIYKIIYSDYYQCNSFTEEVTIIVNPLPELYSIIGDLIVCSNTSNAHYTLTTTPQNYRYQWFTNDGDFLGTSDQSRNCYINWPSNPGSNATLSVDVWIYESTCHLPSLTQASIVLTANEAPDTADVMLKPNSTILACSDSTTGIYYQWGYDEISTGYEYDFAGETLQYVQLPSVPDITLFRYWVDTYFNYGSSSCTTRSYYNAPPLPLEIDNINTDNFRIYPNPVRDVLHFDYTSTDQIELEVIDILGRSVECDIDYENNVIHLLNIKSGIYMLIVKSNTNEFIKKFIVK